MASFLKTLKTYQILLQRVFSLRADFFSDHREEYSEILEANNLENVRITDEILGHYLHDLRASGIQILEKEGFNVDGGTSLEYRPQLELNGRYIHRSLGREKIQLGAGTFENLAVETVTHELGHGLDYRNSGDFFDGTRSEAFWRTWDLHFWDVPRGQDQVPAVLQLCRERVAAERFELGKIQETSRIIPRPSLELRNQEDLGRTHRGNVLENQLKTGIEVN